MKKIQLDSKKAEFLTRRHPWVFSGAIKSKTSHIEDGEIVQLTDHEDNVKAVGFFQPGSIAVRVLSFENVEINQSFWNQRIQEAIDLRKEMGLLTEDNEICRLVFGEGDNLPGLIVDYYNGVAVIQAHAVGMHLNKEAICEALKVALDKDLKAVYYKSKNTLPERIESEDGYLFGEALVPHIAKENGIKFSINWVDGQKTGFFIDQRDNRKRLAEFCKGKTVLNTFCYSGGFSLYALKAGAKQVDSLDSSEKAIALVEENLKINDSDIYQTEGKHNSIVADAVKYVHQLETEYDIIVLDPPAFAKHKNKRHQAIKAYTRLNANAIRQIKKGGIIFTYSCSQVVDNFQFEKAVIAAAIKCNRTVKIIGRMGQPGDHPINAFHPEGNYLKGLILRVE
jgi:23S rRNA (cytosine1962-C5)-methyltransferase